MKRVFLFTVRMRCTEGTGIAGRNAGKLLVKFRNDASGADLVEVRTGNKAFEDLVVLGTFDVDRDVVASVSGTFNNFEIAVLIAEAIELRIDLFVGRRRRWDFDSQSLVAGDRNNWADLDDCVELHVPRFRTFDKLDIGWSDDINLVGKHRLGVIVRQCIVQRLSTTGTSADM